MYRSDPEMAYTQVFLLASYAYAGALVLGARILMFIL